MARGWESKSVEEQMHAAEAAKEARERRALTTKQVQQHKRREGLLLERTRLVREIERASKRRHLVLLQRALDHIEAELARLEQDPSF